MRLQLNDLLSALHGAVAEANHLLRAQQLASIWQHFDKRKSKSGRTIYVPQQVRVVTPSADEEGGEHLYEVPVASLLPMSSLELDELEMEFDARLEGLTPKSKSQVKNAEDLEKILNESPYEHNVQMSLEGSAFGRAPKARVKLTFKLRDPPQGLGDLEKHLTHTSTEGRRRKAPPTDR